MYTVVTGSEDLSFWIFSFFFHHWLSGLKTDSGPKAGLAIGTFY